jgi:hypothetical protein
LKLKSVSFVFAQNLESGTERTEVLPIGLENAWRSNFGKVRNFRAGMNFEALRLSRVMWSFNIGNNIGSRLTAKNFLLGSKTADFVGDLSAKQHRNKLRRYKFVAAPPGNGLDTHRIWEAIYLGCVPIVLRSHMTSRFSELGIPVFIVESYEEICQLNEQDLNLIYQDFKPKFSNATIWASYWIKRIKDSSVL